MRNPFAVLYRWCKRIWAPNPFVVLLRNAQTYFSLRIWTILAPIRLFCFVLNGFGPFSLESGLTVLISRLHLPDIILLTQCYYHRLLLLLLLLFLTFSALVANPEKTTLHGSQSRSWSAEQGKKKKKKSLAAHPPPPPRALLVRRKNKNKKIKN